MWRDQSWFSSLVPQLLWRHHHTIEWFMTHETVCHLIVTGLEKSTFSPCLGEVMMIAG